MSSSSSKAKVLPAVEGSIEKGDSAACWASRVSSRKVTLLSGGARRADHARGRDGGVTRDGEERGRNSGSERIVSVISFLFFSGKCCEHGALFSYFPLTVRRAELPKLNAKCTRYNDWDNLSV
jgi:hypothetical protein